MITLIAQQRSGSPAELRAQELVPAVYYHGGKDAVSVAVSLKDFNKVWKEAGETTAITLQIGGEKIPVMIHDVQRDPVVDTALHIDFLVVDMNKPIEVPVPVEFTGLAEAEKSGLGTLVKVLHEVHVSALPSDLPHALIVDVTGLVTLSDQIHVRDITLPKGVSMVTDGEEVVALVTAFTEEKETPAMDLSAIEVEKKGKKEEETEA